MGRQTKCFAPPLNFLTVACSGFSLCSVAYRLITVILSASEEPALGEVERDLATARYLRSDANLSSSAQMLHGACPEHGRMGSA